MNKSTYYWSYISLSITIGLLIGISVTYTVVKKVLIENLSTPGPISAEDIRDTLFKNIESERIEYLLKKLSESEDRDMNVNALFVHKLWSQLGLKTSFANYTVLSSYQNKERPNSVIKYDKNGQILYNSSDSRDSIQSQYYLAYSPSTETPLKGTPIYVNFGRLLDFYELSTLNVSVRGYFVIARYSDIAPGQILKIAEEKGAIGLILFKDLLNHNDSEESLQYNLQIDHVLSGAGDPQTPFYPSLENAYRLPISQSISQIPALFVSYDFAMQILKGLKGLPTPENWMIDQDNSNIGPDYEDDSYITVEVNTYLKQTLISNVIGVIEGCIEPDRYVVVGSGGTSVRGTVALIVLSESFAKTMQRMDWCPQRSIIFCSWAPQHYRSIGATEWLEENQVLLESGAIAYLNVDLNIRGNFTFTANSVPILYKTITYAMISVKNPNQEEIEIYELKTIYDSYMWRKESLLFSDPDIGFDFVNSPFLQRIGIPVIEYYYDCDKRNQLFCQTSADLIFNPMDNSFNLSKALMEVSAETLHLLSDRPLLSLSQSLLYFYRILDKNLDKLKMNALFQSLNVTLDDLDLTLHEFRSALYDFFEVIQHINEQNDLLLRKINDILMRLEQTFIDSQGLPYARDQRHVLYGPSYGLNEEQIFPGLNGLVWKHSEEKDESTKMKIVDEFKKHVSVIIFHLNSAIHLLRQTFDQYIVDTNKWTIFLG